MARRCDLIIRDATGFDGTGVPRFGADVGARRWIARIMITWGLLAGTTALVAGETSFAILPSLILYFTEWLPQHHQAHIVPVLLLDLPIAAAAGLDRVAQPGRSVG
jgi:hypothetical protein